MINVFFPILISFWIGGRIVSWIGEFGVFFLPEWSQDLNDSVYILLYFF